MMFKYCECGCKGSIINSNDEELAKYWVFDDLKGTVQIRYGHGNIGCIVTEARTMGAAKKFIQSIIKARTLKLKTRIRELEEMLT